MKFLVAYNGSRQSKAALDLAINNALQFKAKLFVITSMEGGSGEKAGDILRVQKELKQVRSQLKNAGIDHEVEEMARGLSPGEDIVECADDYEVDQIFVGVEKQSKTQKLLLGSTAQYIILKASCPVTTVK